MTRLAHTLLTLTSCAWVVTLYGFTLLPDDAPLWRGSPVGLLILALLVIVGALLAHAWHVPGTPPSSMADQAPRIRRSHWYRVGRHIRYTPVRPSRDWH